MIQSARAAPDKTQQSYGKEKVNHVYAEQVEETPDVVLGEFLVQSFLATVLFDSRSSHSFISSYFVESHDIPTTTVKNPLLTKPLEATSHATWGNQHPN
jgi:hypothetical protein